MTTSALPVMGYNDQHDLVVTTAELSEAGPIDKQESTMEGANDEHAQNIQKPGMGKLQVLFFVTLSSSTNSRLSISAGSLI